MRTLITLGFLFFGLITSAMTGTLDVQSGSLRVQRDDGFKVHFYAGQYPSEISFKSGKVYLNVTRKDIRTDITINMPAGSKLPESGDVLIEGTKSGQTFDITGTSATNSDSTAPVSEYEPCTYTVQAWICRGHGYHQRCQWEDQIIQGYRPVEYYFLTKTSKLNLILNSGGGVAKFNGQTTTREKIYTYQGQCNQH